MICRCATHGISIPPSNLPDESLVTHLTQVRLLITLNFLTRLSVKQPNFPTLMTGNNLPSEGCETGDVGFRADGGEGSEGFFGFYVSACVMYE